MTEFYKSIPLSIRGKMEEYLNTYSSYSYEFTFNLKEKHSLGGCFIFNKTPEGSVFWRKYWDDKTFPFWSESEGRFVDTPPKRMFST